MFYNWSRLSGNCPLNIKDLCDIGWSLQSEINAIRRGAKKNEENDFTYEFLNPFYAWNIYWR